MKTFILLLLVSVSVSAQTPENRSFVSFANEYIPELDERVLTREEVWKETEVKEYFPINDIITKKTLFVPRTGANKAFYQSLNYYNRSLFMTLTSAARKARDEKKTFYVNIVAGEDTPAHAFPGRKNVYKVSEYTEGQWTILGIGPRGELVQDHYQHGEYGKLGRDGISYQHAIKTFKATALRDAAKRAEKNDKEHDWRVVINLGDEQTQVHEFDTFEEYELFYNINKIYEYQKNQYKIIKTKAKKPLAKAE
jgi:hypothetical protein